MSVQCGIQFHVAVKRFNFVFTGISSFVHKRLISAVLGLCVLRKYIINYLYPKKILSLSYLQLYCRKFLIKKKETILKLHLFLFTMNAHFTISMFICDINRTYHPVFLLQRINRRQIHFLRFCVFKHFPFLMNSSFSSCVSLQL